MNLILEGPNCCGKTTLAKFLVEQFGYQYFDPDAGKLPGKDEFKLWSDTRIQTITECLQYLKCSNGNLIIDRLHLTEAVYGGIRRGYQTYHNFKYIDDQLTQSYDPVKLLYCTDNIDSLKQRNKDHDLDTIMGAFERYYEISILDKKKVTVKDEICEILEFLGENIMYSDKLVFDSYFNKLTMEKVRV